MFKKILTSFVISACVAGNAFAFTNPLHPAAEINKDFQNITTETYPIFWQQGESFKSNGNQENPDLYSRQWRKASTNSISLLTPRMLVSYIGFSHKQRLLDVPTDFEAIMQKQNDFVYVVSWTPFTREGGTIFGGGSINPQLPTQRLVIEKDNTVIRPTPMDPQIEALMPHSFGAKYYAFPRKTILDVPYTIRFITGYGDILSMDVTSELITSLIDDEKHFYNAK